MSTNILVALGLILASHAALATCAFIAGYNKRDAEALRADLGETADEIEHAEDVRDDYASATTNVDTSDDADLDGMLHDSAESALGTDGVSA